MGGGINANRGLQSPQPTRAYQAPPSTPKCLVPSSKVGWGPSSGARKILYGKNHVKISAQSELRISGNLRNREWPDLGNAKQKRTEREIQSRRGSCPPPPWRPRTRGGTLLPSRGSPRKRKKEGGSLPLASGGAGVPPGQLSGRRSMSTILLPSTPTFSPSMQRCNTSSPRCNLYLNMVLNSTYYFPMIYGYPMMFE